MEIKKRELLATGIGLGASMAAIAASAQVGSTTRNPVDREKSFAGSRKQTSMVDLNYKPRRINKVIELFEDSQPIFYTTYTPSGIGDGYEMGKAMAKTWFDAINYECEHGSFDVSNLRNFMRGLVDGGPTRSGHRTPMVFASLPVTGLDETYMRCNSWVLDQILAAGVHSIDICHARDPGAIEMAVAAMRYPFDYSDVPKQRLEGLRGNGSQEFASHIWGITGNKYFHVADLWPLNPKGEICLGLKIEDKHAHANTMKTLGVPGVCYAEWGGGDSTLSIVGLAAFPETAPQDRNGNKPVERARNPLLENARLTVLAACKAHNIRPLNMGNGATPIENIKQGTMLLSDASEEQVLAAREYTKRRMPI